MGSDPHSLLVNLIKALFVKKNVDLTPIILLGQKAKNPPLGGFFLMGPGSVLLSHGETPHYHRR